MKYSIWNGYRFKVIRLCLDFIIVELNKWHMAYALGGFSAFNSNNL